MREQLQRDVRTREPPLAPKSYERVLPLIQRGGTIAITDYAATNNPAHQSVSRNALLRTCPGQR